MDKTKIYNIVDSFLAEAQDQDGNYRSLDRLNQDRHLAVEALDQLFEIQYREVRAELINELIEELLNNGSSSYALYRITDLLKAKLQ